MHATFYSYTISGHSFLCSRSEIVCIFVRPIVPLANCEIECQNMSSFRELLSRGAQIESHNSAGRTALTYAATYNHLEAVKTLIDRYLKTLKQLFAFS